MSELDDFRAGILDQQARRRRLSFRVIWSHGWRSGRGKTLSASRSLGALCDGLG